MEIRGIIPPVATPMQANEDLDLPRLKTFLDSFLQAGVHGIFVLGNRGDPAALPALERAVDDEEELVREAARWAREQIRSFPRKSV